MQAHTQTQEFSLTREKNQNFYLTQARKLKNDGDIQESFISYLCALEINESNSVIHKELGEILSQQKKYPESIVCFQKAIELNPSNSWNHKNLGDSLSKIGKLDRAITSYQKAIELNPNCYTVYLSLAQINAQKNQLNLAIKYYQQALQQKQDSVEANRGLADCLSKQDKFKQAIPYYQKATYQKTISLYPEFAEKYQQSPVAEPDFLIVGTPKGGTTSLYNYLIQHPQIIPCIKKEIPFEAYSFKRVLVWISISES